MADNHQEFEPRHFTNRELSWLEFNQRVLDEALDATTPLLERLKFFCIASSNLDEFFEVRVAGLKEAVAGEQAERSADGLTAAETLAAVSRRVRKMVDQQYRCWREELRPALAAKGITVSLQLTSEVWGGLSGGLRRGLRQGGFALGSIAISKVANTACLLWRIRSPPQPRVD